MRTNGVHTSIVVPAASEGIDWRPLLRAGHIGRPDLAGDYLAIGWGREIFSADAGMGRSSSRRRAPRAGRRGRFADARRASPPACADRDHRPILRQSNTGASREVILDRFDLPP